MNPKIRANQHPQKTGAILTHYYTNMKIKVIAITPDGRKVFGQYPRALPKGKTTFSGGEPIEMDGRDIDWDDLIYDPENGRTGKI